MNNLMDAKFFTDEFELFSMPNIRIIGKETRCGGKLGNTAPKFMKALFESNDYQTLKELPSPLQGYLFDWTCDFDSSDNTYSFIHCAITTEGTQVPEGFAFRDVPATVCAKGAFGENMNKTIKRANKVGYTTNWGPYPWNAEYFVADQNKSHWFTPVKESSQDMN